MATCECAAELAIFHRSLRIFHPTVPLYLGCTSEIATPTSATPLATTLAAVHKDPYVRWVPCLDAYGPHISRKMMERQKGVWYPTRHTDFMMEKANLMELAMSNTGSTASPVVAFLDCDVTLLHALPAIPSTASVALSPHYMRTLDESVFGRYNGGYVVATTPEVLWEWRRATHTSRYFDQASLEHVADIFSRRARLYCLPPRHNYGFWRLLQPSRGSAFDEAKRFSVAPSPASAAPHHDVLTIHYDGQPLCSLHTHLCLHGAFVPRDVRLFNDLLLRWVAACIDDDAEPMRNHDYAQAFALILAETREGT